LDSSAEASEVQAVTSEQNEEMSVPDLNTGDNTENSIPELEQDNTTIDTISTETTETTIEPQEEEEIEAPIRKPRKTNKKRKQSPVESIIETTDDIDPAQVISKKAAGKNSANSAAKKKQKQESKSKEKKEPKPKKMTKSKEKIEAKKAETQKKLAELEKLRKLGVATCSSQLKKLISKGELSSDVEKPWTERFSELWNIFINRRPNKNTYTKVTSCIYTLIYILALDQGQAWNTKTYLRLIGSKDQNLLKAKYKDTIRFFRDTAEQPIGYRYDILSKNYVTFIGNNLFDYITQKPDYDPKNHKEYKSQIGQLCRSACKVIDILSNTYHYFDNKKQSRKETSKKKESKEVNSTTTESSTSAELDRELDEANKEFMNQENSNPVSSEPEIIPVPVSEESKTVESAPVEEKRTIQIAHNANYNWTAPAAMAMINAARKLDFWHRIIQEDEFLESIELHQKRMEQESSQWSALVKNKEREDESKAEIMKTNNAKVVSEKTSNVVVVKTEKKGVTKSTVTKK